MLHNKFIVLYFAPDCFLKLYVIKSKTLAVVQFYFYFCKIFLKRMT